MKIAIIGSGISGLTCAHRLHPHHEIIVFEASDRVGGHTHTVDVEENGRTIGVDTGFIVYNEATYPGFTSILRELDVETQPTSMSFSVTCRRTGLEYNGTSVNLMFAQRRNLFRPSFYRMIREILRFNRLTHAVMDEGDDARTIKQFLADERFSPEFAHHYLVPLGASLWSCPAEAFLDFPLWLVVRFLHNHGMNTVDDRPQWRVIKGGSKRYVEKMILPFAHRIRLSTPVRRVTRESWGVQIATDDDDPQTFDHVIFACHSNQALNMLADAADLEKEILGRFPYQPNRVFLHRDTRILPRIRKAWASWNYHIPRETRKNVSVTYDMNILQSLDTEHTYNVTLNDDFPLAPDKIIQEIDYEHPLYSVAGMQAQKRHHELIDHNRTSYCGAYWGNGFHEDGVQSAFRVTDRLLAEAVT